MRGNKSRGIEDDEGRGSRGMLGDFDTFYFSQLLFAIILIYFHQNKKCLNPFKCLNNCLVGIFFVFIQLHVRFL